MIVSNNMIKKAYKKGKFALLEYVTNNKVEFYAYMELTNLKKHDGSISHDTLWVYNFLYDVCKEDGFELFRIGENSYVLCSLKEQPNHNTTLTKYIDLIINHTIEYDYNPVYVNMIVLLDHTRVLKKDIIEIMVSGINVSKRKGFNNISILDFEDSDTFYEFGISSSGFIPYFQPVFDQRTTRVTGLESLIRWRTQDQLFSPNVFVPIAIKKNIIIGIDFKMLKEIFRMYEQLSLRGSSARTLPISVNVAMESLTKEFLKRLRKTLEKFTNFKPEVMIFDFKLSIMNKIDLNVLSTMKKMGFKLCIKVDTFDMDELKEIYSRLKYDYVKVGAKFINSNQFIKAKTFLTQMQIPIIGTFVETVEDVNLMKEQGVSDVQGYFYEKPIDLALLKEKYLNKGLVL